jgi:hypothetical protein
MNDNLRPILEASYAKNKEAKNILEKNNYKLDKGLSTKEAKVFVDENGTPNIAVRGSKTAKDWLISDPLLALGLSSIDPRQKSTNKLIEKTKKKYGNDPNLFGHSLGGALVSNANTKGKITTFNKGAGASDLFRKISKNQTDIRTSGDIVSALSTTQRGKNKITLKNNNILKAHGLSNLKKKRK